MNPPGVVGLHSTHATPQMLYDRYQTLERLRRRFPHHFQWLEPFPALFLKRFLDDGNEEDLQALLGVLAGSLAGPLPEGAEIRDASRRPSDLDAVGQIERLRQRRSGR
jgi:hypothetical protein